MPLKAPGTSSQGLMTQQGETARDPVIGPVVEYDKINKPGSYVSLATGYAFQIEARGLAPGHSPLIKWRTRSKVSRLCVMLDEKADCPLDTIRERARDIGITPNF